MAIGVVYIDFKPIYFTFRLSFQLPFNGIQGKLLLMTPNCLSLLEIMTFNPKDKQ